MKTGQVVLGIAVAALVAYLLFGRAKKAVAPVEQGGARGGGGGGGSFGRGSDTLGLGSQMQSPPIVVVQQPAPVAAPPPVVAPLPVAAPPPSLPPPSVAPLPPTIVRPPPRPTVMTADGEWES
mgnify:CR=1 FL=1